MNTYHVNSPETQKVARLCFPDYNGRKIKIEAFNGPKSLTSYWSGGSKNNYSIINLETGKIATVPENGTPFTQGLSELKELPINCVLGEHTIFCGKDLGITLYLNENNITKMLPENNELTKNQHIVLTASCSLKSSYAGISNYRFFEAENVTGISSVEWHDAREYLILNGFLNKAGAVNDKGRNARKYNSLFDLRKGT